MVFFFRKAKANKKFNKFDKEIEVLALALSIAIFGPLVNLLLGHPLSLIFVNPYLYWAAALLIYVAVLLPFLLPFTYKSPLTLLRLIILGVTVEDFFSNVWRSLFFGKAFLPFFNWYTQHFPFLGRLGEPTPLILIPQWYVAALVLYFGLTYFQHKQRIKQSVKQGLRKREEKA